VVVAAGGDTEVPFDANAEVPRAATTRNAPAMATKLIAFFKLTLLRWMFVFFHRMRQPITGWIAGG
jgi:hypothetical protein